MNYKQFKVTQLLYLLPPRVHRYIQLDNQYTAYGKVQTTHIGHNINTSSKQKAALSVSLPPFTQHGCTSVPLPSITQHGCICQCPYPFLPNLDASVSVPTPFYPTWLHLSVPLPSFTQHGCICQYPYPLLPNMDVYVSAPTLFYPHGCICQCPYLLFPQQMRLFATNTVKM